MSYYYYDGTRLLSLKDTQGNIPEIYICIGKRGAGKVFAQEFEVIEEKENALDTVIKITGIDGH